MATVVIDRGSDWSAAALYSGWGDIDASPDAEPDYDATYQMLGKMVVDRFHEIARENDSTACWFPYTSEVIADVDGPEFPTDEWLETARNEIWDKWIDGEIEPIYMGG